MLEMERSIVFKSSRELPIVDQSLVFLCSLNLLKDGYYFLQITVPAIMIVDLRRSIFSNDWMCSQLV